MHTKTCTLLRGGCRLLKLACGLSLLLGACSSRVAVVGNDGGTFLSADSAAPAPIGNSTTNTNNPSGPIAGPLNCADSSGCPPDEWCEKAACEDPIGTCIRRPPECARGGEPECGCDTKTYDSACHRQLAGVNLLHRGPCLGVRVFTDKAAYGAGEQVRATVENGDQETIFVEGCTAFDWQRLEKGAWKSHGSAVDCDWEGEAAMLPVGDKHQEQLVQLGGTWMLSVRFGVGCTPGKTLSEAECTGWGRAISRAFTVDPWPANCDHIDASYQAAIDEAMVCDPSSSKPQCNEPLASDSLYCGCPGLVNDLGPLLPWINEWEARRCDTLPLNGCPKCHVPQEQVCLPSGVCDQGGWD